MKVDSIPSGFIDINTSEEEIFEILCIYMDQYSWWCRHLADAKLDPILKTRIHKMLRRYAEISIGTLELKLEAAG